MPSLSSLKRIAFFGGVASLGGSLFLYFKIQANFSKGGYFKKSLTLLKEDKNAMKILGGPPISVGYIHLLDTFNYVDGKKAQLAIPVTGSNHSGTLVTRATRESFAEEWEIKSLIVNINQNEIITVVDGPTIDYRKQTNSSTTDT